MGWNETISSEQTYEVRLRFWRARGLLSTSGGILFATVSGECTRNAKSVVLARLSDAIGRTEGGEEGIIISNNDHHSEQVNSENIDS